MQAELIDDSGVGKGVLGNDQVAPAAHLLGRFDRDEFFLIAAGVVRRGSLVRGHRRQPEILRPLVLALGVDLPGLAFGVAAPAEVEDLHYAGRLDLAEVDLGGDDHVGVGQAAQRLDHVRPPALGVGADLTDLADESEDPAHVAQLEPIGLPATYFIASRAHSRRRLWPGAAEIQA